MPETQIKQANVCKLMPVPSNIGFQAAAHHPNHENPNLEKTCSLRDTC